MSDTVVAGFFLFMGLFSLASLVSDLRTGVAAGRNRNVDVREYPGWFYLLVFTKTAFAGFAFAVVLHAFGLISDPMVWMQQALPFLMPRQRG
jgi:hypothetical protein